MDARELMKLGNKKIQFSVSDDSLVIKSLVHRYADLIKLASIESIEKESENVVLITVPDGSFMGDHDIAADLGTGIVTADGKIYDKTMPAKEKTTATRFTPTINGFSIGSAKRMPSEDGYACSCKVYFNGKKVGDFLDKGDGSEYSFWANAPYDTVRIEQIVRSFPSTNRDYGWGPMEVAYDMNQMVCALMEMKEIAKQLKKLEGTGRDYVLIDDWKSDRHLTANLSNSITDEELKEKIKDDLASRGFMDFEIRRYRNLEDLHVVNTFVCEDMLR